MNEPTTAEVMEELESILLGAEFAGSDRLSRFLRFIIEHYLAGNLDRLKETVIGVEVFGREPGYDPKIEPIVRIEARRLRSKLEQFYEAAGRNDAVHISVPKGGYVPEIKSDRSCAVVPSEIKLVEPPVAFVDPVCVLALVLGVFFWT